MVVQFNREDDWWDVELPDPLTNLADSRNVTVVFDPKDQQPGREDLLVQPGSLAFNELLELTKQNASVGKLYLSAADLQVQLPDVLDISTLGVTVEGFDPKQTAEAVSFHFLIELESVSSFHRERFETVSVDLANGIQLPILTERLLSHTGQLTRTHRTTDIETDDTTIENHYRTAVTEIQDRIDDELAELVEAAEETVDERTEEIQALYNKRREELKSRIPEQKQEIQKWRDKRQSARKESTKERYQNKLEEAKRELAEIRREIKKNGRHSGERTKRNR